MLGHANRRDLPILGICRAHQLLNVYHGGSSIQDIPSQHETTARVAHRPPNDSEDKPLHTNRIINGALPRAMLQLDTLTANSHQHRAVQALAQGFLMTARSEDGIIEAMGLPGES